MLDLLERLRLPLLFLVGFALAAAVWLLVERAHDDARPLEIVATDAPPGGLKVEVMGAVRHPGVYAFEPGARIADAIDAAGGPTDDATIGALNMAARLHDEQRLAVPAAGDATLRQAQDAASVRPVGTTPAPSGVRLIDLNSADQGDLELLPGIGPVLARRIIDSRAASGPFATPDDLVERGLVSRSVLDRMRSSVVAGPPR